MIHFFFGGRPSKKTKDEFIKKTYEELREQEEREKRANQELYYSIINGEILTKTDCIMLLENDEENNSIKIFPIETIEFEMV